MNEKWELELISDLELILIQLNNANLLQGIRTLETVIGRLKGDNQ